MGVVRRLQRQQHFNYFPEALTKRVVSFLFKKKRVTPLFGARVTPTLVTPLALFPSKVVIRAPRYEISRASSNIRQCAITIARRQNDYILTAHVTSDAFCSTALAQQLPASSPTEINYINQFNNTRVMYFTELP